MTTDTSPLRLRCAPAAVGRTEVIEMQPCVGSILDPCFDGDRFVRRPVVRPVIGAWQHRRPEHGSAGLWRHAHLQPREVRLASRIHVRKIEEESVQPRAEREVQVGWYEIVMDLVVLPRLIPEHLQIFTLRLRNSRDVADPLRDRANDVQLGARPVAPCIVRCTARINRLLIAPQSVEPANVRGSLKIQSIVHLQQRLCLC
mmetsp:Transcript_14552/g.28406  ORF Transcript_14552/g.28406 Transcript_14552/m.28406 type:complete len:201 (+) Transcript_14552:333-935(+)